MASDKSVAVSIGRKISKDYNSTDVRVALECNLSEGESAEDVIPEMTARLKEQLRAAFARIQGKGNSDAR